MSRRTKVTILDVAERAGVHPSTVSRALSAPGKVAAPTRARVEQAVRELGFVPNRAARGLITGRTGNVAVVVPDITNPFFALVVRAIERAARSADLQVLLVDTGEEHDEEVRAAHTLRGDVDGFVVVSPRRLHRNLDALGEVPTVFVNRPVAGRASVLMRSAAAAQDAMHHLALLGHRRLAYIGGPAGSWAADERRRAVRATAAATGIELVEIAAASPTFEAAHALSGAIIGRSVSAVMAFNDQMALGVLAGMVDHGRAVPGDVSIVGCDDVPMAAMVAPPLTTIHMPTAAAGAAAVELLHGPPTSVTFAGSLIIRSSTSAAGSGRRHTTRTMPASARPTRPAGPAARR